MIKIGLRPLSIAALVIGSSCVMSHGEFAHPGISHTSESLEFVRSKIEAGETPWVEAWEDLGRSRRSSLDHQPAPHAHVERGAYNNPDIGSSDFSGDANASYMHALQWAVGGDVAHAKKAAKIIDAWSNKLESISNHDARLLVGMEGYEFCNAAELLKHTWDGWGEKSQGRFEAMLRDIFYPVIKDFHPSANGNWDASMIQTMMAMGVFLDDQAMFDRAKDYFLRGEGNGAVGNYFKPSGQCQESGRDQGHTQMGLDYLACAAEIGWSQGVDLYGALDNRLLSGFEYTAKYNLGFDVPYEPFRSIDGRYHYKKISDDARGRLRPMYEKVLNHYVNRKGVEAPFTRQAVMKLREGANQGNSRRRRSPALGTLMFSGQPSSFSSLAGGARPTVVCFGDSITKRGYFRVLGDLLGAESINAGVAGNSTAKGLRRMQKDVLARDPQVVVILFGTNDLRADAEKVFIPVEKYRKNLDTMVARCGEVGAKVVLCSLPPIRHDAFFTRHERAPFEALGGLASLIDSYRDASREVALAHELPWVDLNHLLAEDPEWLSKDGVHPSSRGNTIIAEHISKAVAPLLEEAK
ncbi:MAG: GDSL-type esterase/lipase family protein [Verrucomicrobiales bacterium]